MMKKELLVALISSAVALSSAGLTVWGQHNVTQLSEEFKDLRIAEERRLESEKALSRYREPLARATYDLQSRLHNILEQDFISSYFVKGNEKERS
jgi:hypothetical protein